MASKATALQTLTNHGGKRKVNGGVDSKDGGASSLTKKLKSHNRTMSTDEAKRIISTSQAELKVQNKIIRDKQKEIRELKKQIEAVELIVQSAKTAKSRIESRTVQAATMVKSDTELIIEKVKDAAKSYCSTEALGRDAVDDMISLGDEADVLRIVGSIRALARESPMRGALKAIMDAQKQQKLSSSTVASGLRELYLPLLQGTVKPTDYKIWPLIATAISMAMSVDAAYGEDYYVLLSSALPQAVEQMKKVNSVEYGRYDAEKDRCPLLDLLLPTYNAISIEEEAMGAIKASLWQVIRESLLESVSEVEAAKNHSMPEEAAIATKKGFRDLARFLLSPTETSLEMNLSKAGRMEVHRLIDYSMGYGKLTHRSEGFGRSRYLVVSKAGVESAAMVQKRKEGKQRHEDILLKHVYHPFVIELPPPETKLGISLDNNTTLNLPEVKGVTADSPISNFIPPQFHQNCCIASMKSDAIGYVRAKTAKECVMFIAKAREGTVTTVQGGNKELEMVLLPLKEESHVPPASVDLTFNPPSQTK